MPASEFELRQRWLGDNHLGSLLTTGMKGLEKESLRVTTDGGLAHTPHATSLGSALTHPYITTDFSEALIELITPPQSQGSAALEFMDEAHRYVYEHLGDELLFASSMPCSIGVEADIPLAEYGSSNIGRMKNAYRRGLSHRYGRAMQIIAGIHFNFSVPTEFWPRYQQFRGDRALLQEFIDRCYFELIRNVQRYDWLLLYLFGASPALCKSFLTERPELAEGFVEFDADTWSKPYATSLRMSDIGYRNANQAGLHISTRCLADYAAALERAIATPYPAYEQIGVLREGEHLQLNTHILQIENEFYSSIRPKQPARRGERPAIALKRRGVLYVEIRSLDLNPFEPLGIDATCVRFLETFLYLCLFLPSADIDAQEKSALTANFLTVATRGREPGLHLQRGGSGERIQLRVFAEELAQQVLAVAAVLDQGDPSQPYTSAARTTLAALADPELTPAARTLRELREQRCCYATWVLEKSKAHADYFRSRPLSGQQEHYWLALAKRSLDEQRAIEESDTLSFEEYKARYFAVGDE